MAGTRKYNPVDEDTAKLTIIVPKDIDRQLRVVAARHGSGVGPLVREWIVEKLDIETAQMNRPVRRMIGQRRMWLQRRVQIAYPFAWQAT
jgi:plasmid stability protein